MNTTNSRFKSKELLHNHLEFLRTHRGRVSHEANTVRVESPRPEFTYLILGETPPPDSLLERFNTVHLTPWSALNESQLKERGYTQKGGLTYMTLGPNPPHWRTAGGTKIRTVSTLQDMDVFSEVQGKGFLETPEAFAIWHPFLREANHRNLGSPTQSFYIGSLNERAVGVALTVVTGETAGIYAVTTLPDCRKQGVSAAIMSCAVANARKRGSQELTLQVAKGSYAESFYERLGFRAEFNIRVFSR